MISPHAWQWHDARETGTCQVRFVSMAAGQAPCSRAAEAVFAYATIHDLLPAGAAQTLAIGPKSIKIEISQQDSCIPLASVLPCPEKGPPTVLYCSRRASRLLTSAPRTSSTFLPCRKIWKVGMAVTPHSLAMPCKALIVSSTTPVQCW